MYHEYGILKNGTIHSGIFSIRPHNIHVLCYVVGNSFYRGKHYPMCMHYYFNPLHNKPEKSYEEMYISKHSGYPEIIKIVSNSYLKRNEEKLSKDKCDWIIEF